MIRPEYKVFHDLIPMEMCIVDTNCRIVYANDVFLSSIQRESIEDKDIREYFHMGSYENIFYFFEAVKNNSGQSYQCMLFGEDRFVKGHYRKKSDLFYFIFSTFECDTENQKKDVLTGLPTREFFSKRVEYLIDNCRKYNCKFAVLFIDLDGFKPVNDTYGHKAGDIVLKVISKRMKDSLRKADVIARFGGDEFIALLTELKKGIHASLGAKRLLNLIEKPIDIGNQKVSVSASIGIAIFPEDGTIVNDLIIKADKAMYDAKQKNRGYSFYDMKKVLG